MRYNTLKRAGLTISEVSFGCMSLKAETKDNDAIISKAINDGVNLFDTADLYDKGGNEKLLGNALKGKRNDVLISTKVGNRWKDDGSGWDWTPRKSYILQAIDESLKRLQTDHIDLYLLHGGTLEDPIDEVVEAFEQLTDLGKIRAYGISSIRPSVIREYITHANTAAVMTQYSILDRRPEEETLNLLYENEIGILARGTVASGLLIDKPAKEYLDFTREQVAAVLKDFGAHAAVGISAPVSPMRYVIDNPAITTAVVGIRTMQQLDDALTAAAASPLTPAQLQELKRLQSVSFYREHR